MSYFINQIKNNKYNHYKYHYLDHLTTVIDIRDNYWSFAMDLYCINDFSLPINSLAGNLQMPYQTIENISFNLNSDQTRAKESVVYNKDYCRIYSGTFNIDVSGNELLKQDLNNVKLNFELSLFIDPEAAKSAGTEIKQDDLDKLINETSEQRWSFAAYYTNTHLVEREGVISNITGYTLPFGNECVETSRDINVSCCCYDNISNSFNELATISCLTPFQILTAKVKFTYWLELGLEVKTLEKTLQIDRTTKDLINICLDDNTIYDFENNKVIFDPIGTKGFYIPKFSQGYYELELQISQNSALSKVIIKNYFNFIQEHNQPYICVATRTIESLEGFKEVKF